MANREIDPATFTANERAAWDSVATAWRRWWPRIEAGSQNLNDHLVALAGVAEGHRVLDIATGIGEPSVTAARVSGPSGHVLACDLSGAMLEIGRERAAGLGITNIEFLEQDASQLGGDQAADASFDAAVCRWGLMLMLDPNAAAQRVRTALRRGARFAAAVWASPDQVPFIAMSGSVLRRELELPPPAPDEPGPFRFQSLESLTALLETAGFRDISAEPFTVHMEFDSPAQYGEFVSEISSSARKLLDRTDDATRDRLLRALEVEASSFTGEDGRVRFTNRALCAVGTRA